jgi:hypothetical protein
LYKEESIAINMSQVSKFFNLSMVEQRLLVKAVILLWIIRFGQWLHSFQTLHNLLGYLIHVSNGRRFGNSLSQDRIAWAVTAVSRYVVKATCLTQALTLQVLLQKEGYNAALRIGVIRNEEGQLHAHAWVESEGEVLIGGSEISSYTPLLELERYRQ